MLELPTKLDMLAPKQELNTGREEFKKLPVWYSHGFLTVGLGRFFEALQAEGRSLAGRQVRGLGSSQTLEVTALFVLGWMKSMFLKSLVEVKVALITSGLSWINEVYTGRIVLGGACVMQCIFHRPKLVPAPFSKDCASHGRYYRTWPSPTDYSHDFLRILWYVNIIQSNTYI